MNSRVLIRNFYYPIKQCRRAAQIRLFIIYRLLGLSKSVILVVRYSPATCHLIRRTSLSLPHRQTHKHTHTPTGCPFVHCYRFDPPSLSLSLFPFSTGAHLSLHPRHPNLTEFWKKSPQKVSFMHERFFPKYCPIAELMQWSAPIL